MQRDFIEERRMKLMRDELNRLIPPEMRAIYDQHPLLNFLHNAPIKDVVAYHKKMQEELKPYRLK